MYSNAIQEASPVTLEQAITVFSGRVEEQAAISESFDRYLPSIDGETPLYNEAEVEDLRASLKEAQLAFENIVGRLYVQLMARKRAEKEYAASFTQNGGQQHHQPQYASQGY